MGPVTDTFLTTTAQIAATLIGLLLLGGFFYVETGLGRAGRLSAHAGPFVRATIRLTLLLYALVLGISLGLLVLTPVWFTLLYALLAAVIVAALVEWTRRYNDLRAILPIPRDSPWIAWPLVVVTLTLPWALGGWDPARESMVLTLFLAGGLALWSTVDLLLTSFDLASFDEAARTPEPSPSGSPR